MQEESEIDVNEYDIKSSVILGKTLENCGVSEETAMLISLWLKTNSNHIRLAEWLEARNWKATEQEILQEAYKITHNEY